MSALSYHKNYWIQHKFKWLLQRFPAFYIKVQMLRYKGKRYQNKIIAKDSDIVIEGYPRSANSFSMKAFKFSNGDGYKIATHLHAYPQVIMALRYKVPTLVLIRHPFDCISSYAALRAQAKGYENVKDTFSLSWMLEDYIVFYSALKPFKGKFLMAEFSQVLDDYGLVISKLNEMFNTEFIPFDHSPENEKAVFADAKTHLSPSADREKIKEHYRTEMEQLKQTETYKKALSLYEFWTS